MSCIAVVPAHRAGATIAATLESLICANGDFVARVIVVTSAGDPTADVARERAGVEVVEAPSRLSAGAARNLGRSIAGPGADLLLFVDADCELEGGGAAALAAELERRGAAAVAARVQRRGGGVVAWLRHALEFKEAEGRLRASPQWLPPSTTMLCRASALDRSGGFPDLWPGEDLVLAHRMRARGDAVVLSETVRTHHHHPDGFGEMLAHQRRLGKTAAVARALTGMQGDAFVRRSYLVLLLLPARLLRGLLWFARSSMRDLMTAIALLPLYVIALGAWTLGFSAGARAVRSGGDVAVRSGGVVAARSASVVAARAGLDGQGVC